MKHCNACGGKLDLLMSGGWEQKYRCGCGKRYRLTYGDYAGGSRDVIEEFNKPFPIERLMVPKNKPGPKVKDADTRAYRYSVSLHKKHWDWMQTEAVFAHMAGDIDNPTVSEFLRFLLNGQMKLSESESVRACAACGGTEDLELCERDDGSGTELICYRCST